MGGRIPVHVVTGARGSGKTALIARLCAGRGDWLGLVNSLPGGAPAGLRLLAPGCPCCTGRLVLQVSLARALRQTGAARAFVELPDPAHAKSMRGLLLEPPFNLSLVAAEELELPGASRLSAGELGP